MQVKPYTGTEPYLFVTYCPEDADVAEALLRKLHDDGYRCCYTIDDETDAAQIVNCAAYMVLITPEFVASPSCRAELKLAVECKKSAFSLLTEGIGLPLALRLQVGETQKIYAEQFDTIQSICEHLYQNANVAACFGQDMHEEERLRAEAEAARLAEEERLRAEAEAARLAEEERLRAEAEAARLAEEERLRAEAEAARLAEEKRLRAEAEAARLAEEERLRAEAEAARLAEEERLRAEAEAARLAEEERLRAEAEAARLSASSALLKDDGATCYAEEIPDNLEGFLKQSQKQVDIEECVETPISIDENATCYAGELPENLVGKNSAESLPKEVPVEKTMPFAILLHPAAGVYYPLRSELTKLGRSEENCDIAAPHNKMLSRHHADILQCEDTFLLCDVGSSNGTFIDGIRLEQQVKVELRAYSEIMLANEQFIFVSGDFAEQIDRGTLVPMLRCEKNGEQCGLGPEGLQLGRAYKWFSGALNDPRISRSHAEIVCVGDACYLKDLGSINGTFVNHRMLNPGEEYRLNPGDQIQLGDTVLQFMELILRSAE